MIRGPTDLITLVFISIFPILFLMVLVGINDNISINIERNYLDELKECQAEVKRISPICPKVEIKSNGWFFPFFIGVIWGAILLSWINGYIERKMEKGKKKK